MPDKHVIAIANQKGGVGKTTTAVNLAAALAEAGHKTILIDLDPQGNASTGLGIETDQREKTVYDLLTGEADIESIMQPTDVHDLMLVPATSDLSSADVDFAQHSDRIKRLDAQLAKAPEGTIILIDCPPTLGLLTLNAMVAATGILIPLQAEFYALEGLTQLLGTFRQVRESANPKLRINGVLLTMSDNRNNLSQQVEADARATLGELVYPTVIPRNVRVSEAPSFAQPVLAYDPNSKGSAAYRQFAAEFLARLKLVPEVS
ncbi:ParA family protein [Paracoccus sp. PARArs4]|uniref:ParA family protein n=1 Tax=Paracoccus sp. PARArs4 TaxID=2853442 RepID=UPI0024A672BE|nr:ParA family protein [Paracoccus sp. PARArs4]